MLKNIKLSTDKLVLLITIISFTWVLCYKLVFIEKPSIFLYSERIGELFYNILLSVIASSIFYYFVVYLERKRILKRILPSIQKKITRIDLIYKTILSTMYEINNEIIPNEFPDTIQFINIFNKHIKLSSKPPEIDFISGFKSNPNDWYEYFNICFEEIKDCTDIIYYNSAYLPDEFIVTVNKIQKSHFEEQINHFKNFEYFKNKGEYCEFHLTACFMHHYLSDIKKIADYKLN